MASSTGTDRPQTVVVTGASAGIGRATARAFAERGARIGLIARGAAGLEAARADAERLGGQALVLPLDVADAAAVEDAAARVENLFGPIDVWVNNAMVSIFAPVAETSAEDFRRVTDVTYHGVVHGTMAALRRMRPRNRGVIVQVGSALAYRGIPLQAAYCGAKHAIQGFNDSLRAELLHEGSGIRLTMVQLPALNTPQFGWVKTTLPNHPQPVPPIFQPEVAARAIVWAADHPRREIAVGAPALLGILGDRIVPGLLDRYLAATGIEGQQTDRPLPPDHRDNLWQPLDADEDRGAHGPFDDRAAGFSPQWWLNARRGWLAAAATGLAGVGVWWKETR
ncbi:MAG: Short-chain dehydrogenase/reductase SDR [uncultured Thermomicrobiales bacterium]|uniref:Short-chain dehydrogenase/reductase SDR n=1 Tax=uncultured Thermomicrobiales bacterium TaxID=1645740 RepID=A0A6J4TDK0_9BACT|nr:MAG: Short-chain dehydrogenase/reductase SDR [uncultured Thermomicrobiales bacterium]